MFRQHAGGLIISAAGPITHDDGDDSALVIGAGLLRPRAARNKRHDRGADSAGHSHRLPPRLFLS
jgi:hypothetical protein